MADVSFHSDPNEFSDAFFLDWTDHPGQGPVDVPKAMTKSLQSYHFNEGTITVDIGGPPVALSRCTVQGFNYNFASGDPVLLGDNLAGKMPIHLLFDPPLRGLGSQVSASGPVGRDYLAQMAVRLDDGKWESFAEVATLSRQRGSAPFMGARAIGGRSISEAWFDVVDPANKVDFLRVAINHLFFEPAT
ncbi:hypothetical protein [Hydrogenophaga sp. RWCD_12]|uniref:hypothetical protein n=1 Tax=Hydrogenophaga sp. RWCD_12 TaxID=3391190 RepID=UPI0039847668